MNLFDPLSHALAIIVAAAHGGLTSLGLDPSSGLTWTLSIAAVVVTVRVALLPAVAHGVRVAHGRARSLGCLPALIQLPFWIALYHLVSQAAGGAPVGALDAALVASLGAATVLGVPLAGRGYLGAGPTHLAVVAALAGTAALLSYVTQRFVVAPNLVLDGVPEAVVRTQQYLPVLSGVGLLVASAFAPAALIVYWVLNSSWTLAQSTVVVCWFPTPGSAAALRQQGRM